ncbi:J domain-containing protein [Phenylobacterium sp.]|uniref:J domain-containing protein n=1 Tax=Phenylobacterium sp. TaxID=1871053 RepID=UPI0035B434B9
MLYLAIGCAVLALLVWLGRGKPILKRREWRFLAGAFAVACFAAAAYVGMRGGWGKAIVLVVVGLWLVLSTRQIGGAPSAKIGDAEARSILGVGPQASEAEIKEAYARLMRMAHPDKGGTSGLAAQLNAARDRLLRK